ncbi:MAG: hypothetical protein HQ553_14340 [Chloroflexi bacterium]|nr:hypothetical protein [Chloroflexota bacterium]
MTEMMPDEGEFRCALCRGKGTLPSTETTCAACGGKGIIRIRPPAMMCAYCNGRGEVPVRSALSCTVCGGKGIVAVREPIGTCSHCRGTGADPSNNLPCLVCRGKGVITTKDDSATHRKVTRDGMEWVAVPKNHSMGTNARRMRNSIERAVIHSVADLGLLSLKQAYLHSRDYEGDMPPEQEDDVWQPKSSKEIRMIRPSSVGGIVRQLMATERARILGRKGIDLGRYIQDKRTQRWRESRMPLK